MVWEERMVTNIKDKNPLDLKSHQILHLWFSSSFPIGSYAYSHGLEAIIDDKLIKNKNDVLEFIKSILFEGTCRNEYIFIKATYDGIDINDLVLASCASKERQLETLKMGDAFRKIMSESWNYTINNETAFPVCIAQAGIKFHIAFDDLVDFYIQSFISNLINMCVKHIPLSQKDGQDCMVSFLGMMKSFHNTMKDFSLDDLRSSMFCADIYSMKHENLTSRIYVT